MLEHIIEQIIIFVVTYCVDILELMGIFIIIYSGLQAFYRYMRGHFNPANHQIKLDFARALAFALEFKLAGEILRTVITKTIEEMYVLAAIIVLRALLTFVIHWEIKFDTDSSHEEYEWKRRFRKSKKPEADASEKIS